MGTMRFNHMELTFGPGELDDQKKDEMSAFVRAHAGLLNALPIVSTGTTGGRILEACPDLSVTRMKSGPLGGDQQIGAMIANAMTAAVRNA